MFYEVKFKEEDLSSLSLCLALHKLQDSFEAELHPSSSVSKRKPWDIQYPRVPKSELPANEESSWV